MKKGLLIIAMFLLSLGVMAQGKVITKYFNQLEDNEAYTKVSVSQKMFSMFTELEAGSDAEKDFLQAVSKLKGLKVIVGDSLADAAAMYKQANVDMDKAGYEELMSIKDADENFKFSIIEKDGIIRELLMVVGGNQSFIMLSLYGEIDLNSISKIAQEMHVEGLEELGKIHVDKDDDDEKDNDTY
ncbi:MAG: DUF4252 domain-containing protein [Bacteroidales bacterium]|nr:DUF4252 domain-containing protein [Bacteroidales bacterium]